MLGGAEITRQRSEESMAGKLLNNPKLAQNVLKRLNIENETEPEPLNTWQPKLLNDKRAYNVTEREPLNPGQPKLLNNDKRA
jgi:hypothetical protein